MDHEKIAAGPQQPRSLVLRDERAGYVNNPPRLQLDTVPLKDGKAYAGLAVNLFKAVKEPLLKRNKSSNQVNAHVVLLEG